MADTPPGAATILIVDDEPPNVLLARRILERAGYQDIHTFNDPRQAVEEFAAVAPDIVLVDLHMPHLDGYQLMEEFERRKAPDDYLPFLVLTADVTKEARRRAFQTGARDFLTKPIDAEELVLRVASLVETRRLNQRLSARAAHGDDVGGFAVAEMARPLDRHAEEALVDRLLAALGPCDDEPAAHNERVAGLAEAMGAQLGLAAPDCSRLRDAARLHDVGKIAIPQYVVHGGDPGADAARVLATHTSQGAALLRGEGEGPLVDMAVAVALAHHERWDGLGYPNRLAGESIPLVARIVAVADHFVQNAGVVEGGWPLRVAVGKVRSGSGTLFDPAAVEAFVRTVGATVERAAS